MGAFVGAPVGRMVSGWVLDVTETGHEAASQVFAPGEALPERPALGICDGIWVRTQIPDAVLAWVEDEIGTADRDDMRSAILANLNHIPAAAWAGRAWR